MEDSHAAWRAINTPLFSICLPWLLTRLPPEPSGMFHWDVATWTIEPSACVCVCDGGVLFFRRSFGGEQQTILVTLFTRYFCIMVVVSTCVTLPSTFELLEESLSTQLSNRLDICQAIASFYLSTSTSRIQYLTREHSLSFTDINMNTLLQIRLSTRSLH